MSQGFDKRVNALAAAESNPLAGGLRGLEKECLRIDSSGYLSRTAHPQRLGSALTNRFITTDFSEALLEFVTPAFATTWEAMQTLTDIHQFTYERLGDEILWVASMPCRISAENDIPLARYGNSNVGQMKTIYRRGLGHRYGRHMQTIAGVHFNYSLPDNFWSAYQAIMEDTRPADEFRSDQYLRLIRNFRRYGWLVLYLFGASPALCKSFTGSADLDMESMNNETWFEPFATSLRMSDLGYNNQSQAAIQISLNDLDEYIRDLSAAIHTPEPAFEEIGVIVGGEYQQLSANQLQIENEYYSPIRPKRVAHSGERPTAALRRGGVEYVEIRSLDINIFDPSGINQNTMRFMEALIVMCLLEDSPEFDAESLEEAKDNQADTARRGRDPELLLSKEGKHVLLSEWASEIVAKTRCVAELMDRAHGDGRDYADAADTMSELVNDPAATPSARVLDELRTANCSFFDFVLDAAAGHRDYFRTITPLSDARKLEFETEASDSIVRQQQIEDGDKISFEEYLANYFSRD